MSKLDRYELLIIDDLGYVKKTDAETSVLFELIAHRYERRSIMVTANQPFSQWNEIFADSMMTVAAIDRLVHYATIIEMQAQSFRKQAAAKRSSEHKSMLADSKPEATSPLKTSVLLLSDHHDSWWNNLIIVVADLPRSRGAVSEFSDLNMR